MMNMMIPCPWSVFVPFPGRTSSSPSDPVRLPPPAVPAAVEHVLQRSGTGRLHADTIQGKQSGEQDNDFLLQGKGSTLFWQISILVWMVNQDIIFTLLTI